MSQNGADRMRSSGYAPRSVHVNCLLLFEKYAAPLFDDADVLELGPWATPSPFAASTSAKSWASADIAETATDGSAVDYVMRDENVVPVDSDRFDVVMSANVIEHVRQPWVWLAEMACLTRPGGHVVTIAPVSWPYHVQPIDCWRIYPEGMLALCDNAGLEVITSTFEGLEPPPSRRTYPGAGAMGPKRAGWKRRVATAVGWPLPIAYDTITIARKPL